MVKIIYIENSGELKINNKLLREYSRKFKKQLYNKLIDKLCDDYSLDGLITDLCAYYGKPKLLHHDKYKDNIVIYTLEIE